MSVDTELEPGTTTITCPRCGRPFKPTCSKRTQRSAKLCFACRNGHPRCHFGDCQRRAVYGDFCGLHRPVEGPNWLRETVRALSSVGVD